MCWRTVRGNFRTGLLCQYEPAPLQLQVENQTTRENPCMLSDISDGRETFQTGQGQMESRNTGTAGY